MKKSSLNFLKILKTLNKKISYIDSIAKKSSESLIKIESTISENKSKKGLSLWFQRLTGWASILLAIAAVYFSAWSIKLTYENRDIVTKIDNMEELLRKQDLQINVLTKLAENSENQIGELQNLIKQNNQLVSSAQSQISISNENLKTNNDLLGLQVNDQNNLLVSSFFEMIMLSNNLKISNLTYRYFSTSAGPSNDTMYNLVNSFLPILEKGNSNRYLLYDSLCQTKWNLLYQTCIELKKNINIVEGYDKPGYTGDYPPDNSQLNNYRIKIYNQKILFRNQYDDLKKYLESAKIKMPLKK